MAQAQTPSAPPAGGRRTRPPFRADHVGSLLRPEPLLAAREDLGAGRIDAGSCGRSRTELRRRIDEASRYVPLEQLCLSPQCGFSSTVEGNDVTYDEQVAKLELVVEVAAEVWGG
jgi:methionine synthase II (cobalamin-independent)